MKISLNLPLARFFRIKKDKYFFALYFQPSRIYKSSKKNSVEQEKENIMCNYVIKKKLIIIQY